MSERPDDSHLPLIERIPPPSVASPSELRPRDAANIQWYRPTFWQGAALLGWKWVYFLPAGLLLLVLGFSWWHFWFFQLLVFWWKPMVPAVVLPTTYAISLASRALRLRKEPFCIHCGYDLSGLPDNYVCPECGEQYSFALIEEYKRDPDWFIRRFEARHEIPRGDVPFEARKSTRPKSRDGT